MRTIFAILLACSLESAAFGRGYDPESFLSYAKLPPLARPWFANLARFEFSDVAAEKLATFPEAEAATFELMQRLVTIPGGDPEFLDCVMFCIRKRNDFSEAHQKWVRDTLRSKLGRTETDIDVIFKMYGPYVLEKYPTQENEDLLIAYLQDKNTVGVKAGRLDLGYSDSARDVLGNSIGTSRAIQPLHQYAKRLAAYPQSYDYKWALEAIAKIEEREKKRDDTLRAAVVTRPSGGLPAKSHQSNSTNDSTGTDDTLPSWAWVLIIVLMLALLIWLPFRNRSQVRQRSH